MAENVALPWGLQQRFEFIEWRAYWVGRLNRKHLEDRFQISTQQASIDLKKYQDTVPGNIVYDQTEKTYLATADFRPEFLKLSPERFLLQLQAIASSAIRREDTWFDRLPPVDTTPTIVRGPEAYTLRAIIKAIEANASIAIYYQSLARSGMRTICPHALGHDGLRWHVRALSKERKEYRDYVLGRILSIGQTDRCDVDHSDDIEWQSFVTLKIVAHPDLDDRQRSAIEHDYRMENGSLNVTMRVALAFYFIRRHNLDLRNANVSPSRLQLYLANLEDVELASKLAKERSKELIATRLSGTS